MIATSAVELLVKQVWYRSQVKIQRMCSGGAPPETSSTRASPAARLPLEVVREIITYLFGDVWSLRTCSLTCYSWYIASVPHLHHAVFIEPSYSSCRKLRWPNPLPHMHALGLLPLVKTLWIRGYDRCDPANAFSSKRLNRCILRRFRALNNVEQLMIDYLDIASFVPRIQRYFGHFMPTVKFLSLKEPRGSRRQIIYFIGLFQHLANLRLLYDGGYSVHEPVDDLTLIPLFAPPLQGSLVMTYFTRAGLLKDMIELFGGIRFRHMSLNSVDGMRLLLDACAQTLESLYLYPTDPRGKDLSLNGAQALADNSTGESSLQDFDLSRNKSLRTLKLSAATIGTLGDDSPSSPLSRLKYALSTITYSARLEVVVLYTEYDFCSVEPWSNPGHPPFRETSRAGGTAEAALHHRRFEVLREVHKVRSFRLVLCAYVWNPVVEYSVRMLKEAVAEEKAQKGFDDFLFEPLVIDSPRRSRIYLM